MARRASCTEVKGVEDRLMTHLLLDDVVGAEAVVVVVVAVGAVVFTLVLPDVVLLLGCLGKNPVSAEKCVCKKC